MDPTREFADHILDAPRSPMVHLAQELVDHIIDFLHDDPAALLRVSLVSRVWVGRSRTHLCESLKISLSKIPPLDPSYLTPLCGYVKTLHFTWPTDATDPSTILNSFENSEPHTLAIHSCELHNLDEQTIRRYFAKFPCISIKALELHGISLTRGTFLIFLSLFPNVDDLIISVNCWWQREQSPGLLGSNNKEIIQPISPLPLRGSFKFLDPSGHRTWRIHRGKILRIIAALPLQFQTVSLDFNEQSRGEVSTFLNSCSKTVRKMFVGRPLRKSRPRIPSTVPHVQCADA